MMPRFISNPFIVVSLLALTAACSSSDSANEEEGGSTTALDVTFNDGPSAVTHDFFATISFVAADAERYQCQLDQGGYSDCVSPVYLAELAQGSHQFDVKAFSAAGNEGVAASLTWQVDSVFASGHDDLVATNVLPDAVANNSWRGIIRINCDFSHSSYNDPIVYPGQENAAHLHRFYGNMNLDHTTTAQSLNSSGDSSCQGNHLNRSAYWVPALLAPKFDPLSGERLLDENGEPAWQVVPAVVGNDEEAHEIFYYSAAIDDVSQVQPVPVGLRMIAGTASTMPGTEQDTSIVRWHCQSWGSDDAANPLFSATIPDCVAPDRVRMDIFFPSCWNGVDLDSSDHKSHMAYPSNLGNGLGVQCPDSHPVAIARPSYHYAFGVKPEVAHPQTQSSQGWRLASDMYTVTSDQAGGLSLHGDWFNGWHPEVMALMVSGCIQQQLDCHDGNLANGFRLSGTQPGSQIEPAIINRGLGE